jgi:hypothetical protein
MEVNVASVVSTPKPIALCVEKGLAKRWLEDHDERLIKGSHIAPSGFVIEADVNRGKPGADVQVLPWSAGERL